MSLATEFREFISKGDVVMIAVGFIIGAAFTTIVNGLVTDLINPLIGLPGKADFSSLSFTINGSHFLYGLFINAVIYFLIIALVVFFFIVRPYNRMKEREGQKKPKAAPTVRECPECLSSVPLKAKRCAFCTSALPPAVP